MIVVTGIVVTLAAVLHGYIFLLESVWWTRPATWKRFGVPSQADADTTRPLAYNQGFYNLFLALGALIGLVLFLAGATDAGRTLMLFTTLSMVLAAIVLTTTGPRYRRAALIQGTLPLFGCVLLLFV